MRVSVGLAFLAALSGAASASTAHARSEPAVIVPGPATISPEERALVENPAAGIEGAIVLLDESDRRDSSDDRWVRSSRHLRAKILSDSGRSLAEIGFSLGVNGRVVRFWGRTIAPDGKVSELPREALETAEAWTARVREVRRSAWGGMTNSRNYDADLSDLHGTLPNVVPGSVIDYGWTVEAGSFSTYLWTQLQGDFVVRRLRHRWVPSPALAWGLTIVNDPSHRVHVERKAGAVMVTAQDLPAQKSEPLAPRPEAYLASEVIYYLPAGRTADGYGDSLAPDTETRLAAYAGDPSVVRSVVASAGINASDDLETKLRKARKWLLANLPARRAPQTEPLPKTLSEGLLHHDAALEQLEFALTAVARSVGAEIELVRVRHRMEGPWQPEILALPELDDDLLRARRPGVSDAEAIWMDTEPDVPFGTLPHDVDGARGIALSKTGVRRIELPIAPPESNATESEVTITPGARETAVIARWVATYRGGPALDLRRDVRDTPAETRQSRLTEWCGGDARDDALSATIDGADDPDAPLVLHCGIDRRAPAGTGVDPVLEIPIEGPWLARLPDLPPGPRSLPVMLPFRSTESSVIDVRAPAGRVAGDVPPLVRSSGPFGSYELSVKRTGAGFRVTRTLRFTENEVPPASYPAFLAFLAGVRDEDKLALPFIPLPSAR
jgi:hypothetical protein